MLQFEQNATHTYAHLWAQCTLTNATVVYMRYAWAMTDWQVPAAYQILSHCPKLEVLVVVDDWAADKGNFTLYAVVEQVWLNLVF